MSTTHAVRVAAWLLGALGALGACTDDRGPRLTSVTPAAAPRGARVTLIGQRLSGDAGDCATAAGAVQVGLDPPVAVATVIEYADDRAVIEVPSTAALGDSAIVVTVNERASNALAFEVLAPGVASP